MSLAARISALTVRLAREIRTLVRPGHLGLARAWVSFGYVDGTIRIAAAHNIANVTRQATGRYRITFATPFADANYCWIAFARSPVNSGTARMALARQTSDAKTPRTIDVACATGSTSFADTSEMNIVVYR